jgi:hypothetical protein
VGRQRHHKAVPGGANKHITSMLVGQLSCDSESEASAPLRAFSRYPDLQGQAHVFPRLLYDVPKLLHTFPGPLLWHLAAD